MDLVSWRALIRKSSISVEQSPASLANTAFVAMRVKVMDTLIRLALHAGGIMFSAKLKFQKVHMCAYTDSW